jgi:hypothetical protein
LWEYAVFHVNNYNNGGIVKLKGLILERKCEIVLNCGICSEWIMKLKAYLLTIHAKFTIRNKSILREVESISLSQNISSRLQIHQS